MKQIIYKYSIQIIFILYFFILVYSVFLQYSNKHISISNINLHLNLIPFFQPFKDLNFLIKNGIVGNMNLVNNLIGNVLLFIPMPFFIRYFFKIELLVRHLIIAALISVGIESIQYIFLLGVTDIDDVLLNTLGAFIGVKLYRKLIINCE